MSFSVNTKALVGLPLALDRRGQDLGVARGYFDANTVIGTFGLADIDNTHQRVVSTVAGYLADLMTTFADPDADRIRAAIASYRASDLRAAQRADAAISGLPSGLPVAAPLTADERGYDASVFDDRRTPTTALIKPSDHYADMPYKPGWSDLLSPTTLGRDAIWKVTSVLADAGFLDRPIDPLQVMVQPFVGDWAGLLRSAEVFQHLAEMLAQTSASIVDESALVPAVWTGNVASICVINLNDFAGSCSNGYLPLVNLATLYTRVARGAQDNANLMENVVTNIIDVAVDLALNDLTEGALALWTGGGQIREFIKAIELARDIINNLQDAVSDWKSGSGSVVSHFGVLDATGPLPSIIDTAPVIPVPA